MRTRAEIVGRVAALLLAAAVVLALGAITIGPRLLPYRDLVVRSGSMSPAIATGSLVFYRPVPASQLKAGDVIVFREPGRPGTQITHRVVGIHRGPAGRYLVTKGDANSAPDGWRVPATGRAWRAVWSVPTFGYLLLYLESIYGRLLLLGGTCLLTLMLLAEVRNGRRGKRDD